jgi:hypothetical protein
VPTLLGLAPASAVDVAWARVLLTEVVQVEAVAVSVSAEAEGPGHRLATDKWLDTIHSGGFWTPKFKKRFDQAGVFLDETVNKVRVQGHNGSHLKQ